MCKEKERYNAKIAEYKKLIQVQYDLKCEAENAKYKLQKELEYFENSCNHKYDDGKSALVQKGGWVSDIRSSYNSWTDEYEDVDEGYTEYYEKCLICGHTDR